MLSSLLLQLFALFLLQIALIASGDSRIAKAAEACCPNAMAACCKHAIEFNLPLQCEEELNTSEVVEINRCIQKELYTDKSLRTVNIEDSVCCAVFAHDENDEEGICATRCIRALSTPGWSAKQKLHSIRDCKKHNQLDKCFNECRVNRRVFPGSLTIETECTLRAWMKDEKKYLGERIIKRF